MFCFCLPWFGSKILDIFQYHDGHHKPDTLPYLSSYCLLSPLWHESGTYCCFNGFSSYWPAISLQKRRSLTRTISSSIKFVKSINPGSLISTFLVFCTFLLHLSWKYPGIFAKIMQMTFGVSNRFRLPYFKLWHFIKKLNSLLCAADHQAWFLSYAFFPNCYIASPEVS